MEGTDREKEEEEETEDGNNSGDVTEGQFFSFLLDSFLLFASPFPCFFLSLSSSFLFGAAG